MMKMWGMGLIYAVYVVARHAVIYGKLKNDRMSRDAYLGSIFLSWFFLTTAKVALDVVIEAFGFWRIAYIDVFQQGMLLGTDIISSLWVRKRVMSDQNFQGIIGIEFMRAASFMLLLLFEVFILQVCFWTLVFIKN